jgi:hypothetical protein
MEERVDNLRRRKSRKEFDEQIKGSVLFLLFLR